MNFRLGLIALAVCAGVVSEAGSFLSRAQSYFQDPGQRRFGIEVEYVGLKLEIAAQLAQRTLGGILIFDQAGGMDRFVLRDSVIGDLVVKVETNITKDGEITPPSKWVYEVVSEPLYYPQLSHLQRFVTALRAAGAKGTTRRTAVSTQVNQEILNPEKELPVVLELTRLYLDPVTLKRVHLELNIPDVRKKFLGAYSPEMMKRLSDPGYKFSSARQIYDDFFYRQTLELEGGKDAWVKPIARVKKEIRWRGYPRNPQVLKLNSIRLSSLLMKIFKDDPFTKAIEDDEWAYARPLIEHRDENNNFDVIGPVERAHGLYLMAQKNVESDCASLLKKVAGL